jgi:acyl-CoA thioesterase
MPDVVSADEAAPARVEGLPPHTDHFSIRPVLGAPPFSGGDRAVTGGWLRLSEPEVADAPAIVAYSDAWIPAIFARVQERVGVPTVDLSVHFRVPVPLQDASPDDHYLVVFRTPVAGDGFLVEDGDIWHPSGVLVAQSRQLALIVPVS